MVCLQGIDVACRGIQTAIGIAEAAATRAQFAAVYAVVRQPLGAGAAVAGYQPTSHVVGVELGAHLAAQGGEPQADGVQFK